jgi:hypothetical protein
MLDAFTWWQFKFWVDLQSKYDPTIAFEVRPVPTSLVGCVVVESKRSLVSHCTITGTV